jgi:hypothetical protein
MPRLFTLQEAEELLPSIQRWLHSAIESKNKAYKAEEQLKATLERIHLFGGIQPDINAFSSLKASKEQSMERLRQALHEIEESGCLVKDLDIGLVDFPTMLDDKEVYLCWKLGEPNIGFWHHTGEGYKGRKSIDRDFLERHRGSKPH